MNAFYTRCPVIKRGPEKFAQHMTVGGERQCVEFEREIVWLQQSEAIVRIMHGGRIVDTLASCNDHYGYLSSFGEKTAVGEALRYAREFSVTPESSMSVEVVASVLLSPCIETKECAEYNRTRPANYKMQFAYVPDDWRQKVIEDGECLFPTLKNRLLGNAVVWSSKNTPEQNKELAEQFVEKWSIK